jgi:hypothetical protein
VAKAGFRGGFAPTWRSAVAGSAWWIAVADVAPAALSGGSPSPSASALVPQLILAAVLMLLATGLGAVGARQAAAALPELADGRGPG